MKNYRPLPEFLTIKSLTLMDSDYLQLAQSYKLIGISHILTIDGGGKNTQNTCRRIYKSLKKPNCSRIKDETIGCYFQKDILKR